MNKLNTKYWYFYLIIVFSILGKGVLGAVGYKMGASATSNFTKIHPVSYLVLIDFFLNLLLGNFSYTKILFKNKSAVWYLSIILLLIGYLFLSENANSISFIIDTLLVPILFYPILLSKPIYVKEKAIDILVILIVINSLIAILERLLNYNIFTIDIPYGDIFRSTSLLGHPLNNALFTLVFILFILVYDFTLFKKNILIALLIVSLLCFGARGGMYVGVLGVVVFYIIPLYFTKNVFFKSSNKLIAFAFLSIQIIAVIYLVLNSSIGERLMEVSFFDDSANTRLQAWDIISWEAISNFLWANSQLEIDKLMQKDDIEIIENFMIVWVLRFGLIFAMFMSIALIYFIYKNLVINKFSYKLLLIILFLIAAATNNSLSSNTEVLVVFVTLFMSQTFKYKAIF